MKVTLSNQLFELEKLENLVKRHSNFQNHLEKVFNTKEFKTPESFINLPFSKFQIVEILELRKKFDLKKIKKIFVIGIGGSLQGTKAIYNLLKIEKKLIPIEFLDYISEKNLNECIKHLKNLDGQEYLIFVVSKSGHTTETIFNFEILQNKVRIPSNRVIFITEENSNLKQNLKHLKFNILEIPRKISGRFSVFTYVGLAPLAFSGVNIIKILEGAEEEVRNLISEESLSGLSAASKYLSEIRINENLFSDQEFEDLGKWEKQLYNESLGKNDDTFFTSHGNFYIEAHSSLQFYLNSSQVFLNLVCYKKQNTILLEENILLGKKYLGVDINEIKNAISLSIQKDLNKKEIPFIVFDLENQIEKDLGKYMQFKMHEVLYLSIFYQINPFNQPDVQSYKENFEKYLA